nr:MAG TPA: hypothetical protein [Bacteriophage sp.]
MSSPNKIHRTALSHRIKYAIIESAFFHTKNEGNNETDRI